MFSLFGRIPRQQRYQQEVGIPLHPPEGKLAAEGEATRPAPVLPQQAPANCRKTRARGQGQLRGLLEERAIPGQGRGHLGVDFR